MGCSHCLADSKPEGEHMNLETFAKVLEFTIYFERINYPAVKISGGEPIEHPQLLTLAEMAAKRGVLTILLSNGMFLEDKELTETLLEHFTVIQITNDPRFYPVQVPHVKHERIIFETHIPTVSPFGRAAVNNIPTNREGPTCFNLRSFVRYTRSFEKALNGLRYSNKFCIPSINIDGTIVAGEAPSCYPIGTVDSEEGELMHAIYNMTCEKCGLVNKLSHEQRVAVGESRIVLV